jgi:hypothetical protein
MTLYRMSGPQGKLLLDGSLLPCGGWEIFHGDVADPHNDHGWLQLLRAGGPPTVLEPVELFLQHQTGDRLRVTVTFSGAFDAELGWEIHST